MDRKNPKRPFQKPAIVIPCPEALLGTLIPGVTHELNNPLSVIIGFSQSLLRSMPSDSPSAVSLKLIEQEALRCQRLVQDLRALARKPKPEETVEDVNFLLEGIVPLLKAQAKIYQTQIKLELTENLPAVTTNKLQLQWEVLRLSLDALEKMPRGGSIVLGVRQTNAQHLEIYLHAKERKVVLRIPVYVR
jgi:two-component system NtrC family sensor kinase